MAFLLKKNIMKCTRLSKMLDIKKFTEHETYGACLAWFNFKIKGGSSMAFHY